MTTVTGIRVTCFELVVKIKIGCWSPLVLEINEFFVPMLGVCVWPPILNSAECQPASNNVKISDVAWLMFWRPVWDPSLLHHPSGWKNLFAGNPAELLGKVQVGLAAKAEARCYLLCAWRKQARGCPQSPSKFQSASGVMNVRIQGTCLQPSWATHAMLALSQPVNSQVSCYIRAPNAHYCQSFHWRNAVSWALTMACLVRCLLRGSRRCLLWHITTGFHSYIEGRIDSKKKNWPWHGSKSPASTALPLPLLLLLLLLPPLLLFPIA